MQSQGYLKVKTRDRRSVSVRRMQSEEDLTDHCCLKMDEGHEKGRQMISAAAAAKLLQLCPTLCDPIDGSPPGSPIPGILQARTLEWVASWR